MEETGEQERWVGYVDWRNRPALRTKHGGMRAASFVLVVEVMENLAFIANASNLVTYLSGFMNMTPARSATTVTNFMGTAFLLALLGGFFSDAFLTAYSVYLVSAFIQFLGLAMLTIQARSPHLKPPVPCVDRTISSSDPCRELSSDEAAMLFTGLYLVALGVGGIKGSLPSHGAEQLDDTAWRGRKQRSTFFNYFVFCLSAGALIAVTFVVWLEDNKGWQWGFGVSTITILLSIPVFLAGSPYYRNKIPTGSPLTVVAKVMAATILRKGGRSIIHDLQDGCSPGQRESPMETTDQRSQSQQPKQKEDQHSASTSSYTTSPPNNAVARHVAKPPRPHLLACTTSDIVDVRVVLSTLPIFLCTIMLNCCLAQLSTFSVQQAATMDTSLVGGLTLPPASLPIFPVTFILILAPLYNHLLAPLARKATHSEMGITHLQRIGIGLVLSTVAMAVAALVEVKRRRVIAMHVVNIASKIDAREPLPVTFLWIAPQYLFLGSADLFTLAGLLEFFFMEAPARMRSLATSLSWASLAMGYYLSSVLVEIVNRVSRQGTGHRPWLGGSNLNEYRLDLFYWLMCVLSVLNFLHYLFWASRYKYKSLGPSVGDE